MTIATAARTRYTTKAYDPSRKVPESTMEELQTLLRYSPSSVNSQPWHHVIAASEEGKARIARATQDGYAYNEAKILNASHVVVLCARTDLDAAHLKAVLNREDLDGRFANPEGKAGQGNVRSSYVNLHRYDRKDLQHWMEKQVYLALGTLLLGAAALGVDATPMEGFDFARLDEELGLRGRGFTSVVIVSLGYRSDDDFNAKLPKSRLPAEDIFTFL